MASLTWRARCAVAVVVFGAALGAAGPGPADASVIRYEGESAACAGGTSYSNYRRGTASTSNTSARVDVTCTVNVSTGGTGAVWIEQIAHGDACGNTPGGNTANRKVGVSVDGSAVQVFTAPTTAVNGDHWGFTWPATLVPGSHTIVLSAHSYVGTSCDGNTYAYESSTDFLDVNFTPQAVQTPVVGCSREFVTIGGVNSVRLTAHNMNPQTGATDVIRVRPTWDSAWTTGTVIEVALPTAPMPAGGWRGQCEVTRTLDTSSVGSNDWQANAIRIGDDKTVDPTMAAGAVVAGQVFYGTGRAIYSSYEWGQLTALQKHYALEGKVIDTTGNLVRAGGPSTVGQSTSKAVAVYQGPPKGSLAANGAKKVVQSAPVKAGLIGVAAYAGWNLGGAIAGTASELGIAENNDWFCKYNPGYAEANQAACETVQPERSVTQLLDGSGTVIDPDDPADPAWRSGSSLAEVRIDPTRPGVGAQNTAGLEALDASPAQEDAFLGDQGVERNAGGDAVLQSPQDNRAIQESNQSNGCNNSLWQILNPLNIAENMGCVLTRLFVPKTAPWQTMRHKISGRFPFTLLVEIGAITGAVGAAAGVGLSNTDQCGPALDLRPAIVAIPGWNITNAQASGFKVNLPTPVESGCPGMFGGEREPIEAQASGLLGFRLLVKGILTALLVYAVVVAVLRAFGPDETGLEITGLEDDGR